MVSPFWFCAAARAAADTPSAVPSPRMPRRIVRVFMAFSLPKPGFPPAAVTLDLPRRSMQGEEVRLSMRSTTTRSGFGCLIRHLAGAVALTFALSVTPSSAADDQAPQQQAQHK